MALSTNFPQSPFEILDPSVRWFPADEALREQGAEKLIPPLVAKLRTEVKNWRDNNYEGATETSKTLLNWWFKEDHIKINSKNESYKFQYYFAQREAVETVIWLFDVAKTRNKYDLMKFDSSNAITTGMFEEEWLRFVIKMATGSGKTKVMSLIIAWSYFHKLYEEESELSRNFLLIAPNIIVLERIKNDFEGLKIFFDDPILPTNGYQGQNWEDDFQVTLHLQDEIGHISSTGNIFLTNIHRVFENDVKESTIDDATRYFLGEKPVSKTNDSRVDLGDIVREVDELMVINDEAHHVHDPKLAWFRSIADIDNKLKLKGRKLSLQIDVTATPKKTNGGIFVQTICDYPLVEAIYQKVVKNPVLPDEASRAKLNEKESSIFTERYEDYLKLGVEQWKKTYKELESTGKKSLLFVMTDDTTNCDDVARFLESNYPELQGKVLTIHTNKSGDIAETKTGKDKEELNKLRQEANDIDKIESPYKAIVSVLMLKEGWDVKNVVTIVGLRSFSSAAKILPEQTLGRGLRRMFFGREDVDEYVSIIGTPAFMDFVESIKTEGVEFTTRPMTYQSEAIAPVVIEIDKENIKKDLDLLDIEIPVLSARIQKEFKNLNDIDVSKFPGPKLPIYEYSEAEKRKIIFKDVVQDKEHHNLEFEGQTIIMPQFVVGFFVNKIMGEHRLFNCYDILFPKVKDYIENYLFTEKVDLNDPNILRNLSDLEVKNAISKNFSKAINDLVVVDKGDTEIKDYIKVSNARPFVAAKRSQILIPHKSIFNKIVGDSNFEVEFAAMLDKCDDIISFAKNYYEVHFRIDYKNSDGGLSSYTPDFLVKVDNKTIYIIETKGREDLDDIEKIKRLRVWCEDANNVQNKYVYKMLYIKQEKYDEYQYNSFNDLVKIFKNE